jgi:hypothetical protein
MTEKHDDGGQTFCVSLITLGVLIMLLSITDFLQPNPFDKLANSKDGMECRKRTHEEFAHNVTWTILFSSEK